MKLIEFLKELDRGGAQKEYEALRETLGRRPTIAEFYRSGASVVQIRQQYGDWFSFVDNMGDLENDEKACVEFYKMFLREVETTAMSKSFKMVLLEALLEHGGLVDPPTKEELAAQSLTIFQRRRNLISDIKPELQNIDVVNPATWQKYWESNPINAWIGGNKTGSSKTWFQIADNKFTPRFKLDDGDLEILTNLLQELVDYRFASYEARSLAELPDNVVPLLHSVG